MKSSGLFCIAGWLLATTLMAQPITITDLVIIPNRNTLFTPDTIGLTERSDQQKQIALTYQQNNFFIHFKAPHTPPPYAFKLNGYIRYEVNTNNEYAFFTNLPSAEYEFSVRSIARPDLPPARLNLRIESPIWLRWWFMPMLFLYGLLLVGVIFYFLYRYRLRQFLLLQNVRENIARDLHDDMGSHLGSISILSQSVVNLLQKDPYKATQLIHKIGETARQVMDSMGEIIWSVNPDHDSMAQIVVRMRDVGADLLEGQDVVFSLDVDNSLLHSHLPLEQRRDFFLIYKEALTNCAKYAQATHVWVRLERRESMLLVLTIQDDGIGFDLQQSVGQNPLGGNGLKNMRSRAEKIGATVTIITAPGHGSTVTLQISLP